MKVTFQFIFDSLRLLFPFDFYLLPLIFISFLLFIRIVKGVYHNEY